MVRANIPLAIVEGGTYNKTFQWKTGNPASAVDLDGFTARMQIRSTLRSEDVLLDMPFIADPWVADGETGLYIYDQSVPEDIGKYRIYIRDNDSLGLCTTHRDISAVYDLFLVSADNESVLQQYGTVTIYAAATRSPLT